MRTSAVALSLWVAACSSPTPVLKGPDATKSTVTLRLSSAVANDTTELEATIASIDADGNPSLDVTVKAELSGTGGAVRFNPPSGVDPNGKATALLRSSVAEDKTLTVTLTHGGQDVVLAMKPTMTFVPGPPSSVRFVNQPSTVDAGALLPPIRIAVFDANGNVARAPALTVSVRLVEGTPGAVLSGGAARDTVDGGVTFDMLSVDRAGSGYGLQVRQVGSPGFADDSVPFNVAP